MVHASSRPLLVLLLVGLLTASSFLGSYSYRRLVRALSGRAAELPLASALGESVATLRLVHARALSGDPAALALRHDPARLGQEGIRVLLRVELRIREHGEGEGLRLRQRGLAGDEHRIGIRILARLRLDRSPRVRGPAGHERQGAERQGQKVTLEGHLQQDDGQEQCA